MFLEHFGTYALGCLELFFSLLVEKAELADGMVESPRA